MPPGADDSTVAAGHPLFDIRAGARYGRAPKGGHADRFAGTLAPCSAPLLERPGALVTREELRASLWPSDTFVDFEHGLNTAIKRLRYALGDSAGTPRFIETLPRRGYRFIGAIESPQAASAGEQPKTSVRSKSTGCPSGSGSLCWYRPSS